MNSRWVTLISASLVAFASLVIAWHFVISWKFLHRTAINFSSITISYIRAVNLPKISDIAQREDALTAKECRFFDLVLPKDTRVFMTDMTGPTNFPKIGYYYYATYYLFPREVGVSVDQPTRITKDGFLGRTAQSDQEIITNGFDVRIYSIPGEQLDIKARNDLPMRDPVNPAWFDSKSDLAIAFLLPWLTALAGMWLFRLVFPTLHGRMPLLEQLACGLGLGMMAVAALTLGVKLSGFSAHRVILAVTAVGAIAEMWHDRKVFWRGATDGLRRLVRRPVAMAIGVAGLLVFLILFRLAGLQGLWEFDAVAAWALKAKILHLYHGKELVQWFSSPRLAYAHLDYPTLVPALHAATYDSLGHVDEFVTKFWPAWMLLFLLLALASLNRGGKGRFGALYFALLGLLLLPVTQRYIQMEGGTVPMVFFTVLGFVQCAHWLVGKDRARLGLGLTLLFGAAMAKFEGFIFLALVGGWMLLWPAARPSLKPTPGFWRGLAFCILAALPFLCLRVQIPSLHYESGWAGYALHHPGSTLSTWPGIFLILLARLFVSSDFASWSGEGGRLQWTGRWDGFASLYNHSTLGLAWLCLLLAVALWYAVPSRRGVIVWTLAMLVGVLAAFSGVFASFVNVTNLAQVIGYTADDVAGRYLLPVLLAWFAALMTMFFAEVPAATPISSSPGAKPPEVKEGKP
jgi:hypothetical protein